MTKNCFTVHPLIVQLIDNYDYGNTRDNSKNLLPCILRTSVILEYTYKNVF